MYNDIINLRYSEGQVKLMRIPERVMQGRLHLASQ